MNNNKEQREILRQVRKMNATQREALDKLLAQVTALETEAAKAQITKEDFQKALFIIDMNNGFVNFGSMANPDNDHYNDLVPEQLELLEKFRNERQLVNFILEGHTEDAVEFLLYPPHCVYNTEEAEVIPEFASAQKEENTKTYYKNSINGALNYGLQIDIEDLKELREIVICGVCTDLCVLDFARTLARYLDEINRQVHIFVVASMCSTFNAPGHDKEEETKIAYHLMQAAGIEVVNDLAELKEREKTLGLN